MLFTFNVPRKRSFLLEAVPQMCLLNGEIYLFHNDMDKSFICFMETGFALFYFIYVTANTAVPSHEWAKCTYMF